MNGFRITILVLLALAVGALLWIVTIFQSKQEENYEAYRASVKQTERQQRLDAHQDKMRQIGPREETGSESLAAAKAAQERQVTSAEESNVLAAGERKDADRVAEAAAAEAAAPKALGRVASYDREWGSIMVEPLTNEPMPAGMRVALRRNNVIICEAEVGERDLSGQVSATVIQTQFTQGSGSVSDDKFIPQEGDQVIISPYPSSRELRTDAGTATEMGGFPTVPASPKASEPSIPYLPTSSDDDLPVIEGTLTPMP